MERMEAIVRGRVQMVMYRDFVQRKASGLKLVGSVRNLTDGTVHVIAEGPREALDALIQKLWKGPLLARVEGVDVSWLPITNTFSNFAISYE